MNEYEETLITTNEVIYAGAYKQRKAKISKEKRQKRK